MSLCDISSKGSRLTVVRIILGVTEFHRNLKELNRLIQIKCEGKRVSRRKIKKWILESTFVLKFLWDENFSGFLMCCVYKSL